MAGRITWGHTLYCTLLALWLGMFAAIGAVVVPTLFTTLASHTAADTATVLFRLQGLIGFVLLAVLFAARILGRLRDIKLETPLLCALLLSALLLQFWVIPELLAQRTLALKVAAWHTAASILYLLQVVCVVVVFAQRLRTPTLSVPKAPRVSRQNKRQSQLVRVDLSQISDTLDSEGVDNLNAPVAAPGGNHRV